MSERREKAKKIVEHLSRPGAPYNFAMDDAKPLLDEILAALEAAEGPLETATPTMRPDPVGVWQIELTNGTVYNFVASRVMGSGAMFYGVSTGLTEFVIDTPTGRSPVVLAIRSELVVAYRRLADWDGTPGHLGHFDVELFAGPVPKSTLRPQAYWLKDTAKP
jgi:hypothetical protein